MADASEATASTRPWSLARISFRRCSDRLTSSIDCLQLNPSIPGLSYTLNATLKTWRVQRGVELLQDGLAGFRLSIGPMWLDSDICECPEGASYRPGCLWETASTTSMERFDTQQHLLHPSMAKSGEVLGIFSVHPLTSIIDIWLVLAHAYVLTTPFLRVFVPILVFSVGPSHSNPRFVKGTISVTGLDFPVH
jgi:hypothetical protein